MRIAVLVGTRPQAVKIAPVVTAPRACGATPHLEARLRTGAPAVAAGA